MPQPYLQYNPKYPGGDKALIRDIQTYVSQHYPVEALRNRKNGLVVVTFVVQSDGYMSNFTVVRGLNLGYGLGATAMNATKCLKQFEPSPSDGKYSPVSYSVPINFNWKDADSTNELEMHDVALNNAAVQARSSYIFLNPPTVSQTIKMMQAHYVLDGKPIDYSTYTHLKKDSIAAINVTGDSILFTAPNRLQQTIPIVNLYSTEVGLNDEQVYFKPQKKPAYPHGELGILSGLAHHLNNHYPADARANHIQGRITVFFIVEKNGHMSNVSLVSGAGLGGGLPEAAMAAVRNLGIFTQGSINNQPVRVSYSIPVTFHLE